MPEIHEMLGREVDEIDDVRHRFEEFYTDDYFNPHNGDWLSDDYFRIIDLSTKPAKLSHVEIKKLNRSVLRLNEKLPHLYARLGNTVLLDAYNHVAEQINTIHALDENQRVLFMQPIPTNL